MKATWLSLTTLPHLPQSTAGRNHIMLGLSGPQVQCIESVQSTALGDGVKPEAYLEYHYLVTLNTFNLAAEAPVTFTGADGSTLCIGVPQGDLELCESVAVNKPD
jgi:hypothetical protein